MELIDGITLDQWVLRHHKLQVKLATLIAIASALASVHAHEIVHGDLSPVNILVDPNGRPVLTDFGFARSLALRESRSALGGTLGFAAPEQLNAAFGESSPASDCYAWGAIAWYTLVGSPLMQSREPFAMVFNTLSARPHDFTALSELNLPDGIVSCVRACLDKHSRGRPSAAEIVELLNQQAVL
jgi:serine/threonine-protein kinase